MLSTLGEAHDHGWRIRARRAVGKRAGMKSIRECVHTYALDLPILLWTRGRAFPLAMLRRSCAVRDVDRVMLPCISSRHLTWTASVFLAGVLNGAGLHQLGWYNREIESTQQMARRTGSADLPLHGGRVPAWLGERLSKLGAVICQAIVHHYGRDEFLRRVSHPFWFQDFGLGDEAAGASEGGCIDPDAIAQYLELIGRAARVPARRCRTASSSTCMASSSPITAIGRWCSRA